MKGEFGMQRNGGKKFFTKHAKSSAALVSLGIHAVLILVALSFVAVTVITKEEKAFEAKPVKRPKMQLKKLQVPVNIKKKKMQKPKLRKRIVVQPKMNSSMPDIKMPEISGVKGGIGGGAGTGLGGAGSLGFSMPEFELFGVKGKGEKIYIVLDSSPEMMYDEMGGIPAYTIIKEELVKILRGIHSTAILNVVVYYGSRAYARFPNMVPATSGNVGLIEEWLEPLNAVRPGMGAKEYGTATLGKGGVRIEGDFKAEKFESQRDWYRPVMQGMKSRADTVFLLTGRWGDHWYDLEARDSEWLNTPAGKRWREAGEAAKKKLAEENRIRASKGQPPRVLTGRTLVRTYFPEVKGPPIPPKYHNTSKDFAEAMLEVRERYKPREVQVKSGMGKRKGKSRDRFSFNVVHFRKVGQKGGGHETKFKELAKMRDGEYQSVDGLEAIKSYVGASTGTE
jgi:hypothetical protein